MELSREVILQELLETADVLPNERLREVTDFAGFLSQKYAAGRSGTEGAKGLLRHAGSMSFESGEMERILEEVAQERSQHLTQISDFHRKPE